MLDREVERLSSALAVVGSDEVDDDDDGVAALKERRAAVEAQRKANDTDLIARLERVRSKTKLRSLISFWYSELKTVFVRDEMPWLVELGRQSCRGGDEGMYLSINCFFIHFWCIQ